MYKITIEIKDKKDDNTKVSVDLKQPKDKSKSSEDERKAGIVVTNAIYKALEELSKSN